MLIVIALLLAAILFVVIHGQNSGAVFVDLVKLVTYLACLGIVMAIGLSIVVIVANMSGPRWRWQSIGTTAGWVLLFGIGGFVLIASFRLADKKLRTANDARQLRRRVQQRVL